MKTVLVIDDDPTISVLIKYILLTANYSVTVLNSAANAESTIKSKNFDLVLCDIDMNNGPSGFELLNSLKSSGIFVRFAFLSGRAKLTDFEHAMLLGADDYVIKPIEIESLISKVFRLTSTSEPDKKIFAERRLDRWTNLDRSILISKVSEDGMHLIFKKPSKVNERLKIQSSFFDELGIRAPWFRVNSCKQIDNQRYSAQVSFIGMSESEVSRVRLWMIQHPEKRRYSLI